MAPKITIATESRVQISGKQSLLIRELTPKTASDFVAVTTGGLRQDQGILSKNSSAGIAVGAFYTGASSIKSVAPSSNLYIQSSAESPVVLVQLEDN